MTLPDQNACTIQSKPTHAVDILAFVEAQEIPSLYFETPYYLTPAPGGEKIYALLRETLRNTGKVGIAYVVIQARQHLAALMPQGESLVLKTLRWASEPYGLQMDQRHVDEKTAQSEWELAAPAGDMDSTGPSTNHSRDDEESLPLEEASVLLSNMLAVGNGSGIEVEEIAGWAGDDEGDEDLLTFLIPTNPHAAAPHAAGRRAASRRRPAMRPARIRSRRTLH